MELRLDDIAAAYGISSRTLSRWKRDGAPTGLDVWAMREWVLLYRFDSPLALRLSYRVERVRIAKALKAAAAI